MRKSNILLSFLLMSLTSTHAQTLLEEDFETGNTTSLSTPLACGEGWTTVNSYSGSNMRYNWYNEYRDPNSQAGSIIRGANCAACDGPVNSGTNVDGSGPREEILLTPELDLNDTYQLQFTWEVSPMNNRDNSRYDLQVRVVTNNNLNGAETVFSIQSEQMLRESGVTVFPIDTWEPHTSKIDLSDWKGQKVKIAFVYKMMNAIGNVAWIDDVSVKKFTPANGPVASVSMDRFNFKNVYIGEKIYSDVITLTNVGKNGLTITGMDLPNGISTTLDANSVNLRTYDNVTFQLAYEASMTSAASGNAVIHTTGGDVTIAFTANKMLVPEGSTFEGFNAYFPPAGWKTKGWSGSKVAIEGDQSAYCGGDFSAAYLRSPRLDLSNGGKVTFTYYNQYDGESAPEYDISLQVSYDNGDTWITKWTSDYQNGLNQLLTEEVDLGIGTDESYIRWFYPAIESDDEGAFDHSNFTLDRVLLPNVYGADGVPGNCTIESPANNAQEVYPKDIVLKWGPAQFAKGYKLFVGSNPEINNLVNGIDLNDALTYTIPQADYETTYRWKVVAYNDKGESSTASTWRFTTQKDASVLEFPYVENFDELTGNDVPTGWLSTTDNEYEGRRWSPNSIFGFSGTCLYTGWMNTGKISTLTSPEFMLPADGKGMTISFVWGDEHPRSLKIDETGLLKKHNVEGGNGASEVIFEIGCNGEWKQAAYLSEDYIEDTDNKYWREERIDLMEYAGKRIQFRWINKALSGKHNGASLDNIVIDGNLDDYAIFNQNGWDAGKVNYKKAVNSGNQFTLLNKGKNALKVKSVKFNTANFQSTIAAGQEIPVDGGVTFNVQFNAGESVKAINDEMTVEFESGYSVAFPVSGEALASDVLYYGFENNDLDYNWKNDFTTIDVDRKTNSDLGYYETVVENDGGRYAFTQVYHYNSNLTAHNGIGTIAASAPYDYSDTDDWLISKALIPAANASLDFYARNLGTTNSVYVGDNDLHSVEVLVSETENSKTSYFKTVMNTTEMSYLGENQWHHFTVDLSAYAGKTIYVAVRHTAPNANNMAFFDDLTFNHVSANVAAGIETAHTAFSENAQVAVYSLNGIQVANGKGTAMLQNLEKGVYVVKVTEGQNVQTLRIIRK